MHAEEQVSGRASLEAKAQRIRKLADKSDAHLIEAARLLRDLRKRLEDGEAGRVKWIHWVEKYTGLRRSRIFELVHIGDAADPHKALLQLRAKIKERVQKYRRKHAAARRDLEPARKALIDFAKTGPLEQVEKLAKQAENLRRHAARGQVRRAA